MSNEFAITWPLKKVSNTSALIGEGEFGVTIDHASRFTGSELKHLIGSINKMSAHLQSLEIQKNRLKDQQTTNEISEITRGLAHSIRNPLHTILLSLELRPDSDEKYTLMQENIKQQIHRIDQHIKSLMVITTHEALTPEPINLHQLLRTIMQEQASNYCQLRVVTNVATQLADNQALEFSDAVGIVSSKSKSSETDSSKTKSLETELSELEASELGYSEPEPEPSEIESFNSESSNLKSAKQQTTHWCIQGVYSELHAVLATLINNAVEAIDVASFEQQPQSEAPVMIYLSRSDNAVYQIAVADKGKGMSEQQRAQLFKPHNTNKTHGSGMGLYIAQRIISGRYGGDIQYQQNQPEGSVFVVTLSNRELNGSQNRLDKMNNKSKSSNTIKNNEQSV